MSAGQTHTIFRGYLPVIVAITLCLGTLLFNMLTFSALANEPAIGDAFRAGFNDDAPVAASYVLAGDLLRKFPGLSTLGDDTARAVAAPLQERVKSYRKGAVALFFGPSQSDAQGRMLWAHRMQPWLLLLAALLWWRRPKPVHLRERLRA